ELEMADEKLNETPILKSARAVQLYEDIQRHRLGIVQSLAAVKSEAEDIQDKLKHRMMPPFFGSSPQILQRTSEVIKERPFTAIGSMCLLGFISAAACSGKKQGQQKPNGNEKIHSITDTVVSEAKNTLRVVISALFESFRRQMNASRGDYAHNGHDRSPAVNGGQQIINPDNDPEEVSKRFVFSDSAATAVLAVLGLIGLLYIPRLFAVLAVLFLFIGGVSGLGIVLTGPLEIWTQKLPEQIRVIETKAHQWNRSFKTVTETAQKIEGITDVGPPVPEVKVKNSSLLE
ncbi:357_t:CDS:2, partial [Racocetra fulgida]